MFVFLKRFLLQLTRRRQQPAASRQRPTHANLFKTDRKPMRNQTDKETRISECNRNEPTAKRERAKK